MNNKDFSHFLITQFNLLQFPLGIELKEGEAWLNWTRERIKLFKEFCLPSLDQQTCKNFTWLIYFDEQTPEEFNWLIDELNKKKYIKIRFSKGNSGFLIDHISDIQQMAGSKEWIISSRIDNDDVFHKDAIKTIQENFVAKDEYLISLTSGYTLNLQTRQMGHYYYPEAPFISIIERTRKSELKSIYCKSHTQWDAVKFYMFKELFNKNNKSTFVINQPYWIQLVHGKNVSNSAKRGFPVMRCKDLTDFAINFNNQKYSIWAIPSFYSYFRWKRYFKVLFVRVIKLI